MRLTPPLFAVTLLAAACGAPQDEAPTPSEIESAIELDNGGLTDDDEAPAFGDALIEATTELETTPTDPMASDPTLTAPDLDRTAVFVMWGQIPGDRDVDAPRDWSGTFSVNRGGIVVRRVLRFEDRTDGLLPRTNRGSVAFHSITRPHHDGLALTIVAPADAPSTTPPGPSLTPDPIVLTYTGDDGTVIAMPLPALLDGRVSTPVDDLGNRMVAAAVERAEDPCGHGFVRGRWHELARGRGVIRGAFTDPAGDPRGHLRGVFGVRRDGTPVFFAKVIDREGAFKGLLTGTYADGHFEGRWMLRGGDRGVVRGQYGDAASTTDVGGHFLGRWAERTCGE